MSTRKQKIIWGVGIMGFVLLLLLAFAEFRLRPRAQRMRTQLLLSSISTASSAFQAHMSRWPTSASELVSNSVAIVFIVPSPPWRDVWDHSIAYEPFTTNSGFGRAVSYGRDGKPGGLGQDADIEVKFP
jgi:hypothetical protein